MIYVSDSRYANQKSDNLVDQSLDEALNQINKLKEDMNNLCEDIDSLYNTKSNVRLNNYLDEKDEDNNNNKNISNDYDDDDNDMFDNNNSIKCNCIYSEYFIQNLATIELNLNLKSKRFNNNKNRRKHICNLSSRTPFFRKRSRLLV